MAFEALEDLAVLSVLEDVADCFLGLKLVLSSSADWFSVGIEDFLNNPFVETRVFNGRAEIVLLPELMLDEFADEMTGLGDCWRREPGEESFEEDAVEAEAILRVVEGVFNDFTAVGRLRGVLVWSGTCVCGNVLVEARKSVGAQLSVPALDVGLELTARGGPIELSF